VKIIRSIEVIDTHTAGEPTRVVVDGLPPIVGETMLAKQAWFESHGGGLRRFLLREPRGHNDMFGAVVFPPCREDADVGVLFLESGETLAMCVHGTIGVVTALVESGRFKGDLIRLDTPAGLVTCMIDHDDQTVRSVTLRNVPSFVLATLPYEDQLVCIAYGGNLFALVDVSTLGVELQRESLPQLVAYASRLMAWINGNHVFRHPESGRELDVKLVEFFEAGIGLMPDRNVVVFGHDQVDRSPCGTGTSAKMAYLHAHGKLAVGEPYTYCGILDTKFVGRIVETMTIGGVPAVIPEITGSAHITGMGTLVLTEDDPFPEGFCLMPASD
jgi:proline racemase